MTRDVDVEALAVTVVVAPPLMVNPPFWLPFPMVELALTIMPTVVVGAKYPLVISHPWPNAVDPLLLVIQTPLTAKHPLARLMPLLNVEVAEPVTLRADAWIPAPKVEVA